jgi:protease IV
VSAKRGAGAGARQFARNAGRWLRDAVEAPFAASARCEWLVLRLENGVLESPAALRLLGANRRPAPATLFDTVSALQLAACDPALRGVLVRVGGGSLGWAQTHALARPLADLHSAGKRVIVYARRTGNSGAWLASRADAFWMAPGGSLDLVGMQMRSPYVRAALDRFGIVPRVIHAGRFKSAGEIFERRSASESSREALDALADDLYSALVDALASGRAGSAERARAWIDGGPYLASQALELGLIDALVYPDELRERLRAPAREEGGTASAPSALAAVSQPVVRGGPATRAAEGGPPVRGVSSYLRLRRARFRWEPLGRGTRIAIAPLLGAITEARAQPLVRLLERLGKDARVAGVVLRVNSPGGDPQASEEIWRAILRLRERKPVVASMGDVAASGGYYAAMAAQEIVAEPTTLTGSTGVVMLSLEVESALRDLGIAFDGVQRGRNAGIFDATRGRSEDEIELLRRQISLVYDDFVRKVAQSRGHPQTQVEDVAQGRVWSGRAAVRCGLIDALGGLETAVERARALAGLRPGEGDPVAVPLAAWPRWLERVMPGEVAGSLLERLAAVLLASLQDGPIAELSAQALPRELAGKAQLWCPIQATLQ